MTALRACASSADTVLVGWALLGAGDESALSPPPEEQPAAIVIAASVTRAENTVRRFQMRTAVSVGLWCSCVTLSPRTTRCDMTAARGRRDAAAEIRGRVDLR